MSSSYNHSNISSFLWYVPYTYYGKNSIKLNNHSFIPSNNSMCNPINLIQSFPWTYCSWRRSSTSTMITIERWCAVRRLRRFFFFRVHVIPLRITILCFVDWWVEIWSSMVLMLQILRKNNSIVPKEWEHFLFWVGDLGERLHWFMSWHCFYNWFKSGFTFDNWLLFFKQYRLIGNTSMQYRILPLPKLLACMEWRPKLPNEITYFFVLLPTTC